MLIIPTSLKVSVIHTFKQAGISLIIIFQQK